jgi:hypothetical protein
MSAPVISAVVPAVLPRSGGRVATGDSVLSLIRAPLPLPSLISRRTSNLVYGLAAIDDRGRVADRVVMRALGWRAGLRLVIEETGGVLTVHTDASGDYQVTGQGHHLRLPAPLRHRCALAAGDRVLLAADLDRSRLTIYPPATLDTALALPTSPAGGEPAC